LGGTFILTRGDERMTDTVSNFVDGMTNMKVFLNGDIFTVIQNAIHYFQGSFSYRAM